MQTNGQWHAGELLAFDLETTGVDPLVDVPVSFALVRMVGGVVETHASSLVDPGRPIPAPAIAVHGITDDCARAEGMALADAVTLVAQALLDASARGVPVVGMKLDFDLTMVDACHRREYGWGLADAGFSGPAIDALVLDRRFDRFRPGRRCLASLCDHYGVQIEHAHDAASDAEATLHVVLAMCLRFPELRAATPGDLYRWQMEWHREWAESYSQWRLAKAMLPLEPRSGGWPIACASEEAEMHRAAG